MIRLSATTRRGIPIMREIKAKSPWFAGVNC
jgi:hypothetical protein